MRKWTIIDTIIVAIVAVVGVVGAKIFIGNGNSIEKTKVEFVVLADNKEVGFSNSVTVGEKITISLSGKDSGIVKKVEAKPAQMLTFDNINGLYYNNELDGKEDSYIYIEAECDENDFALSVGESVLKVGSYISVRGKGYATEGHIVAITTGGDSNE